MRQEREGPGLTDDHAVVVQALTTAHRRELGELRALCAVYRALLEEASIDAPADGHGAEALRRYRSAFIALRDLDPEQRAELTEPWWSGRPIIADPGAPLEVPTVWPEQADHVRVTA